jgi:basic membrane protein A
VAEGYNVLLMPGYAFAGAIVETVEMYPDVKYVALDVSEFDLQDAHGTADDFSWTYPSNMFSAVYQEELAGYMAGVAAVKLGYTKIGYLGGMAVPAVVRYGYGFVQGANAAAEEMGIADEVSVKYWYCGGFAPTDDIQIKMAGWFTDGTEIVFACGGGIYLSAVAAATAADGKVIGVDVDQSAESECIVTSAMKGLSNSVVLALEALWNNNGKWSEAYAGQTAVLGVADDCVGLPTAEGSWRLNTFTVDEYNALFEQVKNGEITISNDTTVEPTVAIAVDYNA